jgi:hypothetical protein
MTFVWLLVFVLASSTNAVPTVQLNTTTFAACLALGKPAFDLVAIDKNDHLSLTDMFFLYLSVYAGKRYPLLNSTQQLAFERFSVAYWPMEGKLADQFARRCLSQKIVTPGQVFGDSFALCKGDYFCAALICHNMLRTIGRWRTAIDSNGVDYNPTYFRGNKTFFTTNLVKFQRAMIQLNRLDGIVDLDRFGYWYHFFGLQSFAVHYAATTGPNFALSFTKFAAFMGKVLNTWLAGGAEEPVKVQVDKDSCQVAFNWITGKFAQVWSPICDTADGYLATK